MNRFSFLVNLGYCVVLLEPSSIILYMKAFQQRRDTKYVFVFFLKSEIGVNIK